MKQFLLKIAQAILTHYAAMCVYETKQQGKCLCKYCEKADCKMKKSLEDLEVIQNGN